MDASRPAPEFALAYLFGIALQYFPIRAMRQVTVREAIVDAAKLDHRNRALFLFESPVRNGSNKMTIYGYARVSTDGQKLDAQETELRAAGVEKIFKEKTSG